MSASREHAASDDAGAIAADQPIAARIAHVALWTRDVDRLELLREFYERHLGAHSGAIYRSERQPGFASYFLDFGDGAKLELMTLPSDDVVDLPPATPMSPDRRPGYAHIALSLGSAEAVDAVTARLAAARVPVLSQPRWTGDGYYESVIADPDGNLVELTA
jgi:lactoylglutathione lyase